MNRFEWKGGYSEANEWEWDYEPSKIVRVELWNTLNVDKYWNNGFLEFIKYKCYFSLIKKELLYSLDKKEIDEIAYFERLAVTTLNELGNSFCNNVEVEDGVTWLQYEDDFVQDFFLAEKEAEHYGRD